MNKDSKIIVSSIILGASFILGSCINAYFNSNEKILSPQISQTSSSDNILNKEEAAAYLKIPVTQLDNIIKRDTEQKRNYRFMTLINLSLTLT
ncbi:hypothetical protein B4V02_13855 [Paenibacillus kribbensis]|uniref:Uncharacterized protein n=1 Tax=Paenibacillus kribbensis TaxID=172713 RepID=A0A222WNY4_9BACL|nr:hypothetical protein [Paenibacillus kribbensis]ASR47682.1 hypothetical protein B4V02_13855 [Paenibacillus kribbensis]